MQQRQHLALLPGGIEEAGLAQPGREAVFVQKRLGFIKLALQHGYTTHPVYSFGESSFYACLVPSWVPNSLRWALARRGIPVVAPLGRWWAPLMPQEGAELHTYVGHSSGGAVPVRLNDKRSHKHTFASPLREVLDTVYLTYFNLKELGVEIQVHLWNESNHWQSVRMN